MSQPSKPGPIRDPVTKPWWQSKRLPAACDADYSYNGRALQTLMGQKGPGEHPRWIAEDIAKGHKPSIAKLGDLVNQLEAKKPGKGLAYQEAVLKRLPQDRREELLAYGRDEDELAGGEGNDEVAGRGDHDELRQQTEHSNGEKLIKSNSPINLEGDRIRNLTTGAPGKFEIKRNPDADGGWKIHEIPALGRQAVNKHQKTIDKAAKKHDVDPDLIRP